MRQQENNLKRITERERVMCHEHSLIIQPEIQKYLNYSNVSP